MGCRTSKLETAGDDSAYLKKDPELNESKTNIVHQNQEGVLQPGFCAPDSSGKVLGNMEKTTLTLKEYKGSYVVLLFYPFISPYEIIQFNDKLGDFKANACEIIGISTDSEFSIKNWLETPRESGGLGKIYRSLIADQSGIISKMYGVLNANEGVAFRGLIIIDGKGILRQITVNDLPLERDVNEVLRVVEAFRFTDEIDQTYPPGWSKGRRQKSKAMQSLLQVKENLQKDY